MVECVFSDCPGTAPCLQQLVPMNIGEGYMFRVLNSCKSVSQTQDQQHLGNAFAQTRGI